MLKSLLTLTVLSAALALPAVAQDATSAAASAPVAGGMAPAHQEMSAEKMQEMKAKGDQMYQQRQAEKTERRAKVDQMEADCHAKMQAATTPEQMKSIMQSCHEQGKQMREQAKSDMQAKRAAWKAQHPKMGGQGAPANSAK